MGVHGPVESLCRPQQGSIELLEVWDKCGDPALLLRNLGAGAQSLAVIGAKSAIFEIGRLHLVLTNCKLVHLRILKLILLLKYHLSFHLGPIWCSSLIKLAEIQLIYIVKIIISTIEIVWLVFT